MPNFDTPQPISVTLDVGMGDIQVVASDRTDTVVEVRPSDPATKSDVAAAEQTRVEYANGALLVKAPKGWRHSAPLGRRESIDVHDRAADGLAGARRRGGRRRCAARARSASADSRPASATSSSTRRARCDLQDRGRRHHRRPGRRRRRGHHRHRRASRIGSVDGTAVVKNSNGDTWIGEVTGDVRVNAANGDHVDRARRRGVARRPPTATSGSARSRAAPSSPRPPAGRIDVGVRDGVAAWLDLTRGSATCATTSTPPTGPSRGRGDGRGARPHLATATSRSAAATRPARGEETP